MPKIWRGRALIKDGVITRGLDDGNIIGWSEARHKDTYARCPEVTEEYEDGVFIKVECIEEDDGTITNIR